MHKRNCIPNWFFLIIKSRLEYQFILYYELFPLIPVKNVANSFPKAAKSSWVWVVYYRYCLPCVFLVEILYSTVLTISLLLNYVQYSICILASIEGLRRRFATRQHLRIHRSRLQGTSCSSHSPQESQESYDLQGSKMSSHSLAQLYTAAAAHFFHYSLFYISCFASRVPCSLHSKTKKMLKSSWTIRRRPSFEIKMSFENSSMII